MNATPEHDLPAGTAHRETWVVVSADAATSSMAFRDRIYFDETALPGVLDRLRAAGLARCLMLSTCDRTLFVTCAEPEATLEIVTAVLADHAGMAPADVRTELKVLDGRDALRHVFGVASSLQSSVIGDPQVLGQFKAAARQAAVQDLAAGDIDALACAAVQCAKRVRTETAVGERAVSLTAAAVAAGRDLHGDFKGLQALLIGLGEQGLSIARGFRHAGLDGFGVLHPHERRAETAARDLGCHVIPFENLAAALVRADVIITALGNRNWRLDAEAIAKALRQRRQQPILVLDLGLPGDTDPAIDRLDGAFRFGLGDLERIADEAHAERKHEALHAWAIVDEEIAKFERHRAGRDATPGVLRLRAHIDALRATVMAQAGDDAEKATRMLVNRLLHAPSSLLRGLAEVDGAPERTSTTELSRAAAEALILQAFGISPDAPPKAARPADDKGGDETRDDEPDSHTAG